MVLTIGQYDIGATEIITWNINTFCNFIKKDYATRTSECTNPFTIGGSIFFLFIVDPPFCEGSVHRGVNPMYKYQNLIKNWLKYVSRFVWCRGPNALP